MEEVEKCRWWMGGGKGPVGWRQGMRGKDVVREGNCGEEWGGRGRVGGVEP